MNPLLPARLNAPSEEIQYTCYTLLPDPFLIVIGIFPILSLPPFLKTLQSSLQRVGLCCDPYVPGGKMGHKQEVPLGRLKIYRGRESKPKSWFSHPLIRAICLINHTSLVVPNSFDSIWSHWH